MTMKLQALSKSKGEAPKSRTISTQLNGYVAIFGSKQTEIYASSLYDAKQKAMAYFKPSKKKEYLVSIMLATVKGEQVIHSPDF